MDFIKQSQLLNDLPQLLLTEDDQLQEVTFKLLFHVIKDGIVNLLATRKLSGPDQNLCLTQLNLILFFVFVFLRMLRYAAPILP